ncbi:MAG: transcription repressor NadR [Bacillota bacterium]|uniref:Transcription repressor NadR n=1 Tax=Virgibacillus salarius TaxID=447199 RepID=A0A941DXY9_9BACI|nr:MULTISPECIES: transcription repressor NadR [Bacillaceae]NAZ09868.1 HTH domain-containing protein [Agaribacter marinus]MBR7797159.1 transcription repressor NadR [Virgibacillus salarius]MCC2251268.1 transcription repressor NadR [Virgibacillus sp. AGTR]MDY7043845.1 transcription repressor NadR [Virgibacillus sp. M23]QRZ20119.1 transcription repressor NadR [Virgibacillus sp. AGTR]
MNEKKKMLGDERRKAILAKLKANNEPTTGGELAKLANVSRQVIVSDITLLKARNEPIIATSQGYVYIPHSSIGGVERTVACQHTPERTEEELHLLVDHGITVKDVKIEHSVYGDLTASIMVSNRKEVAQFIEKISTTGAAYLSELTDGVHIHTLIAANEQQLVEAENALKEAGFLIENK